MKMNLFITNGDAALCSRCGLECSPVFDSGDFCYDYGGETNCVGNIGDRWLSACCSEPMGDISGGEWTANLDKYDI